MNLVNAKFINPMVLFHGQQVVKTLLLFLICSDFFYCFFHKKLNKSKEMQLILHIKNEKIDLSDLTTKDSDFEKMWVARLDTQRLEAALLQSHFPMIKKDAETIGVYYQKGAPVYIHRRLVHDAAVEYFIVVEMWMLAIYFQKKAFETNFQNKQVNREKKKAIKAERQKKMAKHRALAKQITDNWLEKSKHNSRNWRETFKSEKSESDKLLQLLDKKMLS